MTALLEGICIFQRTQDFASAFKSEITLRRIREHSGEAGLQSYLAAVEQLRQNLISKGGSL
jgi:hypothetical protein